MQGDESAVYFSCFRSETGGATLMRVEKRGDGTNSTEKNCRRSSFLLSAEFIPPKALSPSFVPPLP